MIRLLILATLALQACRGCRRDDTEEPDETDEPPEEDLDGDGWEPPEDCDDADPTVSPGATDPNFDGVDQDCDGADGTAWFVEGTAEDDGFGAAVCWMEPSTLAIGAPFGSPSRVFRATPDGVEVFLESTARDLLGVGLASEGHGDLLAGAPWRSGYRGAVVAETGAVVLAPEGPDRLLGGRVATHDGAWVVTTAEGWRTATGSGFTDDRPGAVSLLGGDPLVGIPLGPTFLATTDDALSRPSDPGRPTGSEAGRALAVGDLDADGEDEVVVGAPGWDEVWVLDLPWPTDLPAGAAVRITGTGGRFGASVAVADLDLDGHADLAVGAPFNGDDGVGTVSLFLGPLEADLTPGDAAWTATGTVAWAGLGTALAAHPGGLAAGAPGAPGERGYVGVWQQAEP